MRKIFCMIIPVAALMAACGGGKKTEIGNKADSDSALTEEMVSPVAGDTVFYLTVDSLGPVKVGEKMASLPDAVANLYDNVEVSDTPDAVAYTFRLADVPQFTVYDFMDGQVDIIALEGDAHGVSVPVGTIRVGDPFTRVLELPGVVAEWQAMDEEGIWYWKWQGLFFGVDEMGISEELADGLCDEHRPPRAGLFGPGVKVGYIGTGLPF